MTEEPKFQVFVSGLSSSVNEWQRAWNAPLSELPKLDAGQMEFVRKFGISEEEYARGYLAGLYGRERMRNRGIDLGAAVEAILGGLGADYELKAVISEMTKGRWVARVRTPQQVVNVAIERELADDIVDSNTVQDQERLRRLLLSSLGRSELIGKQ